MNRTHAVACALLLLLVNASGCRVLSGNGFGNARIAPPGTNSYQVQSANQPYYAPAATAANPNVLPPIGPTAASTGAMFNPNPGFPATVSSSLPTLQPGWRPADAPANSGFYGPTGQPNGANVNPTSFQPWANDYRSTTIDERYDPTRMPANDATMVRAPTNFNPTGNWQMLNPGSVAGSNYSQGQFEYRTSPQIAGVAIQSPQVNSMAQSTIGYPTYPSAPQSAPVVLAQASTSPELLARDPNYQAGWRDRFTTGTYMNR